MASIDDSNCAHIIILFENLQSSHECICDFDFYTIEHSSYKANYSPPIRIARDTLNENYTLFKLLYDSRKEIKLWTIYSKNPDAEIIIC